MYIRPTFKFLVFLRAERSKTIYTSYNCWTHCLFYCSELILVYLNSKNTEDFSKKRRRSFSPGNVSAFDIHLVPYSFYTRLKHFALRLWLTRLHRAIDNMLGHLMLQCLQLICNLGRIDMWLSNRDWVNS